MELIVPYVDSVRYLVQLSILNVAFIDLRFGSRAIIDTKEHRLHSVRYSKYSRRRVPDITLNQESKHGP
jgi:hypothetical protein